MKKLAVAWIVLAVILAVMGFYAPLKTQQFGLYCGVEGAALLITIFTCLKMKQSKLWIWALLLFFLGDMTYVYFDLIVHHERSFPNIGDAFYLAFYPLCGYGLYKLVPFRQGTSIADSVLLALGLAIPWWIFVEFPVLSAPGYNFIERLVSVAYPFGDIVLIALAIRLLFWKIPKGGYSLVAAFVALVLTDSIYAVRQLDGSFQHGSFLDYGWFLFYVLWGLAFLLVKSRNDSLQARQFSSSNMILLAFGAVFIPMMSVLVALAFQRASWGSSLGIILIVIVLAVLTAMRIRAIASSPFTMPDQDRAQQSEERIAALESDIARILGRLDTEPEQGSSEVERPPGPVVQ